eukprot:3107798-Amphidinium_carterae.1
MLPLLDASQDAAPVRSPNTAGGTEMDIEVSCSFLSTCEELWLKIDHACFVVAPVSILCHEQFCLAFIESQCCTHAKVVLLIRGEAAGVVVGKQGFVLRQIRKQS